MARKFTQCNLGFLNEYIAPKISNGYINLCEQLEIADAPALFVNVVCESHL